MHSAQICCRFFGHDSGLLAEHSIVVPFMRSGSKFANTYRGAPIIGLQGGTQQLFMLLFHAYFSLRTVIKGTQNTIK
jgi:hypothetical protein